MTGVSTGQSSWLAFATAALAVAAAGLAVLILLLILVTIAAMVVGGAFLFRVWRRYSLGAPVQAAAPELAPESPQVVETEQPAGRHALPAIDRPTLAPRGEHPFPATNT